MFVGDYIKGIDNIGHEIINLFKSDNGDSYIYVLPYGKIAPIHNNKVETILLVGGVGKGILQVLARADGLTHIPIDANDSIASNITYGGVSLTDVFKNNDDGMLATKPIYVTFRAGKVVAPIKPLFLTIGPGNKTNNIYHIDGVKFHLTAFFDRDDNILRDILDDKSLWSEDDFQQKVKIDLLLEESTTCFLNVIQKEYDELAYSNILAYLLRTSSEILSMFVKRVLGIDVDEVARFQILREYKHIDLLIKNDDYYIIIENKIRSGINGIIQGDGNQLSNYIRVIEKEKRPGCSIHPYILTPDYHDIDLMECCVNAEPDNKEKILMYKKIKYSDVLSFFIKNEKLLKRNKYYADCINALRLQSDVVDNEMRNDMLRRFVRAVNATKI